MKQSIDHQHFDIGMPPREADVLTSVETMSKIFSYETVEKGGGPPQ